MHPSELILVTLLLTPIVALVVGVLSAGKTRRRCLHCGWRLKVTASRCNCCGSPTRDTGEE